MGAAISSNVLNDTINIINSVAIKSSNKCTQTIKEGENLVITSGGNVDLFDVNLSEALLVNSECITKANIYNKSNAKLNQTINQIAKSIVQALGLGVADTKNVINSVNKIRNDVKEAFEQTCSANLKQGESVQIDATGDVFIFHENFNETVEDITSCILDIASTDLNSQELTQMITQKATSEVEGLLGPLMAIVIIIVIVIGGLIMKGGSALESPKFWIAIISVVLVYLGLAHVMDWKPFSKSKSTPNSNSKV